MFVSVCMICRPLITCSAHHVAHAGTQYQQDAACMFFAWVPRYIVIGRCVYGSCRHGSPLLQPRCCKLVGWESLPQRPLLQLGQFRCLSNHSGDITWYQKAVNPSARVVTAACHYIHCGPYKMSIDVAVPQLVCNMLPTPQRPYLTLNWVDVKELTKNYIVKKPAYFVYITIMHNRDVYIHIYTLTM